MAWMIPEDKLDLHQKEFINTEAKKQGSIWIQGFAGSGKSVLLAHQARSIIDKEPHATIGFVVFTLALVDLFQSGLKEIGMADKVSVMTAAQFLKNNRQYDYLLCDEVQDLTRRVLEAMKARAGRVIVAGDSNQSIYEEDPQSHEPVIKPHEVGEILNARPFVLKIVHRLTRSIIRAVDSLLPNMNIWGATFDHSKQDVQIRIGEAHSVNSEVKYVWNEAQKIPNENGETGTSAILLPSHKVIATFFSTLLSINGKPPFPEGFIVNEKLADYNRANTYLKQQKLSIQYVGNGFGSLQDAAKTRSVIVMTYHSAKGLDFTNVYLPFLNSSAWIAKNRAEVLFMVAMTRSRLNLYITHTGYRHEFVNKFANLDACTKIDIEATIAPPKASSGPVFDF